MEYKGARLLVTLTQKSVIAIDPATGKLRWSYPHPNRNDQNVTMPLFHDGSVFVTSGHTAGGRVLQLNDAVDSVKELWWNTMTRVREDVAGLEATIIMSPQIWRASGHVDTFSDPMCDCKKCKKRFRADQLCEDQGLKLSKHFRDWR